MTHAVAINRLSLSGKLKPGDPRWAELNDSFENREIELIDLLDAIYKGQSYTAWHQGRRKHENFIKAGFIAVDMDTDDERSTFDAIQRNHFFRLYGSILHTTPSHTEDGPRCRAIFLLDQPIASIGGYRMAIETVYRFFDGADPSCIDPSRFFYGNANLQLPGGLDGLWYCENILPLENLRRYARQMLMADRKRVETENRKYRQNGAPQASTAYAQAAFRQEVEKLAMTGQGNRNNQLNDSAFRLGTLIADGLLEEGEVARHLEQAAKGIGLGETEVIKTLRSGLRAGLEHPRGLIR